MAGKAGGILGLFVGAAEITAGIILVATGNPAGIMLIAAGAGSVISGVGTLMAGDHLQGFATATRNPIGAWGYSYGYCRPKPTMVFMNQWGSNNQMLDMVFTLNAHQTEGVDVLLFDTQRVQLDATAVPYPTGGGPGCARPTIGGTSFNPAQQAGNNAVPLTSISRSNDVVTVVLPRDIPLLSPGDRIGILETGSDTQLQDYGLIGVALVQNIISRVPSGGTNILTFTFLSGGLPCTFTGVGQAKTLWPMYGRTVYMEVLTGGQCIGESFNGMIAGTPWLGDTTTLVSPSLRNDGTAGCVQNWDGSPNPWTNYCSCAGKTVVFLRLTYGKDGNGNAYYPSGIPNVSFLSRGKNDIYDPRKGSYGALGTAGYTDNAALCVADYLSMGAPKGAPWAAGSYAAGSLVSYGGIDYISAEDSNTSTPGTDITQWVPVYNPAIWSSAATYPKGSLVCDNSGLADYNPSTTYGVGAFVVYSAPISDPITGNLESYNAYQYVSLIAGNTGNTPTSSPSAWMRYDGAIEYVSIQASSPGTVPSATPAKWRALPCLVIKTLPTGYRAPYLTPVSSFEVMPNSINVPALITSANVCDQAVPLRAGGTEPMYTCDGTFDLHEFPGEILQALLTSCAGRILYVNGQYFIQPGYWAPGYGSPAPGVMPVFDLVANAASDKQTWRPKLTIKELYNGVKGTYTSPANKWESSDFPAYCQDALHGYTGPAEYGGDINLAADGGQRHWHDVHLRFTTSYSMAQRIAKIELLRKRSNVGTFPLSMAGYQYVPLDVGEFAHSLLGWSDKVMEASAVRFRIAASPDGGAPALSTELDLQETDSSYYAWSVDEELSPQGYVQGAFPTGNTQETVPYVWSPGYVAPLNGDALYPQGVAGSPAFPLTPATFGLQPQYGTDAQGNGTAGLILKGYQPVNDLDTGISGPFITATGLPTGGSLPPGKYYVAVTAHDSGGPSYQDSTYLDFAVAVVQSSGNTGSINLQVQWGSGDDGGDVYIALAPPSTSYLGSKAYAGLVGLGMNNAWAVWHFQQTIAPATLTNLTITEFTQATPGGVDTMFDHFAIEWQLAAHGGIWAQQVQAVTPTTITIGGAPPSANFPSGVTANMFAGRVLTLIGKYNQTVELPVLNMPVASNTAQGSAPYLYTLTIGTNSAGQQLPDLTTLLDIGDVVEMKFHPTFTDTSWSDLLIANPYYPTGGSPTAEPGRIAIVRSGLDERDEQVIASLTTDGSGNYTVFNLAGKWAVTPATGDQVVVAEPISQPPANTAPHSVPNGSALGPITIGTVSMQNMAGYVWLVKVRTVSATGLYAYDRLVPLPIREIYLFGKPVNVRTILASTGGIHDANTDDQNLLMDTTPVGSPASGAQTVQLPSYAAMVVPELLIKKISTDSNDVMILPAAGENIDGLSGLTLSGVNAYYKIKTNVLTWPAPPSMPHWVVTAQSPGTATVVTPLTISYTGGSAIPYHIAFIGNLVAAGGTAPFTFSYTGSLPTGLSLNASTGAITGTPTATGTFTFTGKVTDSASATATVACSITVSAAILPGTGSTGAEIPNATLTSAAPSYSTVIDGVEQWQLICEGTPPTDPRFIGGQAVLCPTAVLAANISPGSPATSLSVTVKPFYPSGVTCNVAADGMTITAISANIAPALANNYAMINGVVVLVATWVSKTACMLAPAGMQPYGLPSPGTGVAFLGQECRYGGFTNGNTIQIDGQQFILVTESQSLDSSGHSTWILSSNGLAVGNHTAGALIWDIEAPPCDPYAGTLFPGATQSVSPEYAIGSAAAYTCFMVSVSALGQNTWPVIGVTPQFGPFIVEVQTPGSLDAARVLPATLGYGIFGGGGDQLQITTNLGKNLIPNGDFSMGLAGWAPEDSGLALSPPLPEPVIVSPSVVQPKSGQQSVLFGSSSAVSSQYTDITNVALPVSVVPGLYYQVKVEVQPTSGTAGSIEIILRFYDNAGGNTGGMYTASGSVAGGGGFTTCPTGQWTTFTLTQQVPPTPHSGLYYTRAAVYIKCNGLTAGSWYLDQVELFEVLVGGRMQSGNGLTVDGSGNLVVNAGTSIDVSSGQVVVAASSLNIGYFQAGSSPVEEVSGTPTLPYAGQTIFDITNGRNYRQGKGTCTASGGNIVATVGNFAPSMAGLDILISGVNYPVLTVTDKTHLTVSGSPTSGPWAAWIDTGDPGDMIAGQLATGVLYAGDIQCSQLQAGTISVAITLTSPDIQATGSSYTITLDTVSGFTCTSLIGGPTILIAGGGITIEDPSTSTDHVGITQLLVEVTTGTGSGQRDSRLIPAEISFDINGVLQASIGTHIAGQPGGVIYLAPAPLGTIGTGTDGFIAISDGTGGYTAGTPYYTKGGSWLPL